MANLEPNDAGLDGTQVTNESDNRLRSRIRVPKTSEIVADHFRGQIVRGELKEGDSLPPEGQLMANLGISRPTLREAFRILEAESLISVVRGSRTGARVHAPSVELVSRYAGYVLQSFGTTISDLYQARLAIEPQVVRWLSTKPERIAIKRLRAEIERLRVLLTSNRLDDFLEAVNEFHATLVDVGLLRFPGRDLDVEVIDPLAVDQCYAQLLFLGCVDEHSFHRSSQMTSKGP